MVRLTVSGATVATIKPSMPGKTVTAVTAAGDDRTFVLGEQGQGRKAVTFYRFRLGSSGRPGAPARLPVSVEAGRTITGLALSPDGTRLAIAIAPRDGVSRSRCTRFSGGPGRTWSATGGAVGATSRPGHYRGPPISARWPSTGRSARRQRPAARYRQQWRQPAGRQPSGRVGGQFGGAGTDAVQVHGRHDHHPRRVGGHLPRRQIIKIAQDRSETYSTGFPEFSTATGRVTRIVGHWAQDQPGDALAVERAVVRCVRPGAHRHRRLGGPSLGRDHQREHVHAAERPVASDGVHLRRLVK